MAGEAGFRQNRPHIPVETKRLSSRADRQCQENAGEETFHGHPTLLYFLKPTHLSWTAEIHPSKGLASAPNSGHPSAA
jgi:hypothetical protein